jgi:hypothetical protein
VLGLLEHVHGRAWFLIVALREAARPREFSPIETEAVEPLAAEMVVDMFDLLSVGDDCEIAALFGDLCVGRGKVEDV